MLDREHQRLTPKPRLCLPPLSFLSLTFRKLEMARPRRRPGAAHILRRNAVRDHLVAPLRDCANLLCQCIVTCIFLPCLLSGSFGEISPPESPRIPPLQLDEIQAFSPLPLIGRTRALTLPLPDEKAIEGNKKCHRRKPVCCQDQSPLFLLPIEVREVIWKYVLTGNVIHIGWTHNRLLYTMCNNCKFPDFGRGPVPSCWPYSLAPLHNGSGIQNIKPARHLLALSKTCRRMYVKSSLLEYQNSLLKTTNRSM